ncbi:hypothetical protein ACFFWD_26995 [Bradyrhizobium erythrophlei]|uniref:hypothetical protein n=1 Tax=Bradyrhizobium erythrophlei TaxID=1437360 RepID=UPI0035EE76DA
MSQNVTVGQALSEMLDINQSEVPDVEIVNDGEPACTELVPLAATTHWAPKIPLPQADPSFIAHLIATAAHEPQTRGLRRGSLADAQTAYGPHVYERRSVARRTRQIV